MWLNHTSSSIWHSFWPVLRKASEENCNLRLDWTKVSPWVNAKKICRSTETSTLAQIPTSMTLGPWARMWLLSTTLSEHCMSPCVHCGRKTGFRASFADGIERLQVYKWTEVCSRNIWDSSEARKVWLGSSWCLQHDGWSGNQLLGRFVSTLRSRDYLERGPRASKNRFRRSRKSTWSFPVDSKPC